MTYTRVYIARVLNRAFFNVVIAMVNVLSINWVILYNAYKKRFYMNSMDEVKNTYGGN